VFSVSPMSVSWPPVSSYMISSLSPTSCFFLSLRCIWFSSVICSRSVSYQKGIRVFIPGGKRSRREVYHSPPSSSKAMNAWSYTSTPGYVFTTWCLIKYVTLLHGVVLCSAERELYLCVTFVRKHSLFSFLTVTDQASRPYKLLTLQVHNSHCHVSR
jgi:hypothetical protein